MVHPYRKHFRLFLLLFTALTTSACQKGGIEEKSINSIKEDDRKKSLPVKSLPEGTSLLSDKNPQATITLFPPETFAPCHYYFSGDTLPNSNRLANEAALPENSTADSIGYGCDAEIYQQDEKGSTYVGFVPPKRKSTTSHDIEEKPSNDLMLVKYLPSGKEAWRTFFSRAGQTDNFLANFRRSFLAETHTGMVCFGTLWEGGTQVKCVKEENGDDVWTGTLPFWSGLTPQSGDNGFWTADLLSLTKRYPFTGEEMRYFKLPTIGGRSTTYLSNNQTFLFASSRSTPTRIVAVDFEQLDKEHFDPKWEFSLKEKLSPSFGYLFDQPKLALLKTKKAIFALNPKNGQILWSHETSAADPSFFIRDGKLFGLIREGEKQALVKLDPKSGKIVWQANIPPQLLSVKSMPSGIYFKSIRSIQKIKSIQPPN